MKYKALALDLDGTLTDSNKNLSQKNIDAIHKAIEEDVAVILASGRPVLGITEIAEQLELKERGGYILAYNGGNIIDCRDDSLLYEKILPAECIPLICDAARKNDVIALTYTKDEIVAESQDDEYLLREAKCNHARIRKVDNLETFVDYPVAKFLVVGEHEKLLKVQEVLLDAYADRIDAFFSESYFLEVVPAGIAKSASLDVLLGNLGIRSEELIACGDGMNDIPMLEYAGLSVAMENAYPQVKQYADYITLSNDEDGVAHVIERYILDKV
mgnify:CR=1 FL=1